MSSYPVCVASESTNKASPRRHGDSSSISKCVQLFLPSMSVLCSSNCPNLLFDQVGPAPSKFQHKAPRLRFHPALRRARRVGAKERSLVQNRGVSLVGPQLEVSPSLLAGPQRAGPCMRVLSMAGTSMAALLLFLCGLSVAAGVPSAQQLETKTWHWHHPPRHGGRGGGGSPPLFPTPSYDPPPSSPYYGTPPSDGGSPPYDGGDGKGSPPYDGGDGKGSPPYGGSPPSDGKSPPYDGGSPPSDGKSPPYNGGSPPYDGKSPPYDGKSPPYDGGSPPYNGKSPPYDGGSPPSDGKSPPYNGGSPPYDGKSPPYDGGSPPPDGKSPPYNGGSPPYDGKSPPYDGGSPPYDGKSPPYDGGSPPYDGKSPPYDGGSPPYDGGSGKGSPPYGGGSPPYGGWFKGCGASYWASSSEKWPMNFNEKTTISDAFGKSGSSKCDGVKLLEALLSSATDGFSQLMKHGTASLFNSFKPGFKFSTSDVKSQFNKALTSEETASVQAFKFQQANQEFLN